MDAVPTWKWLLGIALLLASAFSSGTEAALAALGEAQARRLSDVGGLVGRLFRVWVGHAGRVRAALRTGRTLAAVGAGAIAYAVALDLAALHRGEGVSPARGLLVAGALAATAAGILLVAAMVRRRIGRWRSRSAGAATAELELLIERGTRDGVIDEVREELLSSVLEFSDRVAREIMIPRTRMVAIDRDASPESLLRVLTENPYSRMPVYEESVDEVVGFLHVRDFVQELRHGALRPDAVGRYLKPAYFVPEGMKISRLLKEMQRRKTHLAVVVDEFGGTSGLVTLEDVIEEIVGEIQDEADAEAALVKTLGTGRWLADAGVALHDLEDVLNLREEAPGAAPVLPDGWDDVRFPETGDYETLGGLVTATAGRVPAVGAEVAWEDLVFAVRAGDERRVTKIEITRRLVSAGAPEAERAAR